MPYIIDGDDWRTHAGIGAKLVRFEDWEKAYKALVYCREMIFDSEGSLTPKEFYMVMSEIDEVIRNEQSQILQSSTIQRPNALRSLRADLGYE